MAFEIRNNQLFEVEVCITCGCTFLVPSAFQAQRKRDKKIFYCPSGHQQAYSKSTEDVLKEQLENVKAERDAFAQDFVSADERATKAEKQLEALKKKNKGKEARATK